MKPLPKKPPLAIERILNLLYSNRNGKFKLKDGFPCKSDSSRLALPHPNTPTIQTCNLLKKYFLGLSPPFLEFGPNAGDETICGVFDSRDLAWARGRHSAMRIWGSWGEGGDGGLLQFVGLVWLDYKRGIYSSAAAKISHLVCFLLPAPPSTPRPAPPPIPPPPGHLPPRPPPPPPAPLPRPPPPPPAPAGRCPGRGGRGGREDYYQGGVRIILIKRSRMQGHEGRRLKSKITLENSEDEFSFEDRSQDGASVNWSDKFSGLYEARDRFVAFVESLGPLVRREIREDILAHCEQGSKRERSYDSYMSDDTILRTINLRIDKMLKNKRIKKNWSEEDVLILIWVLSKYFDKMGYRDLEKDMDHQDWLFVASVIPGVTPESCMFKWLSLRKVNLATNNWSEEESQLLATLVNESGNKTTKRDTKDWKAISQRLYFLCSRADKIYRNAKQCREHWNCYLNPNLKKGPWRPEEDIQLLKCIRQNKGCKKWSEIVRYFDGRTENALKNRYTLIIEKQKKHYKHRSELEIIEEYLEKCYVDQFTNEMQHSPEEQPDSEPLYATPHNPHHVKIEDDAPDYVGKPDAGTVTPIKVEKIDFKNMVSFDRIQLRFIQPGTLNNGIFEKSYNDLDSTEISTPAKLQLKRYHSSLL